MIQYIDDIAIMTEIEEGLKAIMERMENIMGNAQNMRFNKGETKIMVCEKEGDTTVTFLRM